MSRHRTSKGKYFRLARIGPDHYRMSWVQDFYYPGSRLRHPRTFSRDTDEAGARRFARRHGCEMPE